MGRKHHHLVAICLVFFAGIFFAPSASAQNMWSELIIVGNKIGRTQLSTKEVRDVFRAKTSTWSNKISVSIALPSPQSSTAEPVARLIYGTKPPGVQKFWLSQVFQGRANPPSFFDSDQELIQFIQKTPGAIGVVASSTSIPPNVTIISIQN